MLKKFNSYMSYLIVYIILFMVLGIIIIIYPKITITIISYIVSFGLIINGITLIVKNEKSLFIDFISIGTISLIFGVLCFTNPKFLSDFVLTLIGIWMIISSIFRIRISLILKKCQVNSWLWTMLLSSLSASCGIIIILNPTLSAITLTTLLGILLIIYSLFSLIDILIFKKNVNVVAKNYKKLECDMRK